ncbi:methyltransferase domain-containing protein [Hyalangium versicolor]|uniref:methyltransferase domain-containing protein n=1 Tax=Hyalangium versicolor TaxID=2861190 RepID=UPI001CCE55CC|nr:methyltransferase domain-containing protein [Hyalangium versicolor]
MTLADTALLACPDCREAVTWDGRMRGEWLEEGWLHCGGCRASWPVVDELPRLFREQEVRGKDRLLRVIYDGLPFLHDPLTALLTPVLQGVSEAELREGYVSRLELGALAPHPGGPPLRILEVGIGAGANLPLIARELPPGLEVEVWGVDLSEGMLGCCRERLRREGHRGVRLLMGDAHALPFPDHVFDRVFEIGGINGYRQPGRALAEMVRVARPGTPLVVVDEQLDACAHTLRDRLAFRLLTFYTREARSPRALLPSEVVDILEEQISRFYFCLSFRTPPVEPVSPIP